MIDDPLAPTACACEGGWVRVHAGYAERRHPDPTPPEAGASSEVMAVYEHQLANVSGRRAATAETYYPCKHCNQSAFYRWAGGHWDSGHDTARCDECHGTTTRVGRRRTEAAAPAPARTDING